MTVRTFSYCVI